MSLTRKVARRIVGVAACMALVPAAWALPEMTTRVLDTTPMRAAGHYTHGRPIYTIDGLTSTFWVSEIQECWLVIDMAGRHWLTRLGYLSRDGFNDIIKNYAVYVTDYGYVNDSAAWGEPVATGTFDQTYNLQTVDFAPMRGRYLILRSYDSYRYPGCRQLYFHTPAFSLADPVTGDRTFTGATTLDTHWNFTLADPIGDMFYALTATDALPADGDPAWQASPAETYTIAAIEGDRPVYAWIRDSDGQHVRAASYIMYTETAPSAVAAAYAVTVGQGEVARVFPAGLDDGSTGGIHDGRALGIAAMSLEHAANTTPDAPYATFASGVHADVVLRVVNRAGNAATATATVTVNEGAEPPAFATGGASWSGAGPTPLWADGANWAGSLPPTNPTPATLTFDNTGRGEHRIAPPPVAGETMTAGTLALRHTGDGHIFDLGGEALVLTGDLDHAEDHRRRTIPYRFLHRDGD